MLAKSRKTNSSLGEIIPSVRSTALRVKVLSQVRFLHSFTLFLPDALYRGAEPVCMKHLYNEWKTRPGRARLNVSPPDMWRECTFVDVRLAPLGAVVLNISGILISITAVYTTAYLPTPPRPRRLEQMSRGWGAVVTRWECNVVTESVLMAVNSLAVFQVVTSAPWRTDRTRRDVKAPSIKHGCPRYTSQLKLLFYYSHK